MSISIVIATYGDTSWSDLANARARPSAEAQGADEVIVHHVLASGEYDIGPARNLAASKASSDWLIFLDADDELAPGYVQAMRKAISRMTFYEGKRVILIPRVSYVRRGRPQAPQFIRHRGSLQDDNFIVVGAGIQRWDFEDVGGFSDYPHGFEDWSLWAKAWKKGAQLFEVPRAVYVAHINDNSKHRQGWRDRNWQVSMHHKVRRDIFPELYPEEATA